jgi:hypothetical protein
MLEVKQISSVAGVPAIAGPMPSGVREWGATITRNPRARGGADRTFLDKDQARGSGLFLLPEAMVPGVVIEWGGKDKKGRESDRVYWVILAQDSSHVLVDVFKNMSKAVAPNAWPERISNKENAIRGIAIQIAAYALCSQPYEARFEIARLEKVLLFLRDSSGSTSMDVSALRTEKAALIARVAEIDRLIG